MAFEWLSRSTITDRVRTDVQRSLPESNPFLRNSFIGALIIGFAGRIYEFYLQLQIMLDEIFPDTASGTYLERWGTWKGITRNVATGASGNVTATGTPGSSIPSGSVLTSADGVEYQTTAAATIAANVLTLVSLTRTGSVATATSSSDHGFATGDTVVIAGAVETEYNGSVVITVTSTTTFTYTVSGAPSTPATGTITASLDSATVPVESVDVGADTNQGSGSTLSFSSPIAGVDSTAYVQFGEIAGGTDLETDDDLRARIIERYSNPVSFFNVNNIEKKAEEVSGVTRVWVEEITPAVGQVTVYFVRDNDASIIPSAAEVTEVNNKLLEIKPAHMDPADLIVSAPTAVPVNFTFSSITPNTTTMQAAIINSLTAFFQDDTVVGADITEAAFDSAVYQTVDLTTGQRLTDFTITIPASTVTIATGEIGTLGSVTFL